MLNYIVSWSIGTDLVDTTLPSTRVEGSFPPPSLCTKMIMTKMTGDTTPPPLVPPLAIGDSVRIKGLLSSSQYNDHKGLVVSCPPEITTNDGNDDRYGVRFRYNGSNKIVSIHISNLDFVHRSSSSSAVIKANNGGNSSANEIMEEDEKMKQQIMHKREFDRIRLKYNLDNPSNAERIANMLSSSSSSSSSSSNNSTATVSATEFATTFGMQIPEAVIFLEWIMIGVKFKEDVLDKNKGV